LRRIESGYGAPPTGVSTAGEKVKGLVAYHPGRMRQVSDRLTHDRRGEFLMGLGFAMHVNQRNCWSLPCWGDRPSMRPTTLNRKAKRWDLVRIVVRGREGLPAVVSPERDRRRPPGHPGDRVPVLPEPCSVYHRFFAGDNFSAEINSKDCRRQRE
jgi:hypothetical protein